MKALLLASALHSAHRPLDMTTFSRRQKSKTKATPFAAKAQQQHTSQALTSPEYKLSLVHDHISERKEQYCKDGEKHIRKAQKQRRHAS